MVWLQQPKYKMTIEARNVGWQRDRDALLAIERASFRVEMQSDEEDLKKQVEKGFGIVIVDGEKPLAYAIAYPLEQSNYPGCIEDSNRGLGNTAYMESFAVVPGESPLLFRRLGRSLVNSLLERGFQRLTMHAEVDTSWYQFLTGLGSKELGRFDDWQGWGETFAYLELSMGARPVSSKKI